MKRFKILLFALFCLSFSSYAQLTSVTATVTDSDSQTWNNCTWKLQWVSNGQQTNPNIYNINGVSITSPTYVSYLNQTGSCNGSGALSLTALDNTQVSPSGSQYVFTIQSNTSAPATQYLPLTISGSSMNLSTYLSINSIAPRIKIGNLAGIYAYADVEITNNTCGNIYWNTVASQSRQWNCSTNTWSTLVTSTWNGGTVVNPVVSPGFSCTGSGTCFSGSANLTTVNRRIMVDQLSGATADVQLNSCISTLHALGGGICDITGYGYTTQTIAASVILQNNVYIEGTLATQFQPSNTTITPMFEIVQNSGIDGLYVNTLNVSNYNGQVVSFIGPCQQDSACYLSNSRLVNGSNGTNPGTGTAIIFDGTINPLSFAHVEHSRIIGFNYGLELNGTNNFVNDNSFDDVKITNPVHCIDLQGQVYSNPFVNTSCEAGGGNIVNATAISMEAGGGFYPSQNFFSGLNIWDYSQSVPQYEYNLASGTTGNVLFGNIPGGSHTLAVDNGTYNTILNSAFPPIQWSLLRSLYHRLDPVTNGNSIYWLNTTSSNKVCISTGASPTSQTNLICSDSSGNLTATGGGSFAGDGSFTGNLTVGTSGTSNYIKLFPSLVGGSLFYLSNNGSLNALQISNGATPGTNPINFYSSGGIDISSGTGGLTLKDEGNCTMSAGVCPSQTLGHSYTVGPYCVGNWTGAGTFTGVLKFPATASTVTPTSTVNTDTAVVNWACFGK